MDALYRLVLRAAVRVLRLYWFVARPRLEGVAVLVRVGDELLLIRNSYQHRYSVPGGMLRRGEGPADAAARELREETGIDVTPDALLPAGALTVPHSYVEDHVHFYELRAGEPPRVRVDRREVVWAEFRSLEQALALELWPPLEVYLRRELDAPAEDDPAA